MKSAKALLRYSLTSLNKINDFYNYQLFINVQLLIIRSIIGKTRSLIVKLQRRHGPAQGASKIMQQEYNHALESIQSKQYITYTCEMKKSECFRVGTTSKCFCGHLYQRHKKQGFQKKIDTGCENCPCKIFKFVPTRPEECGMYWLPRRKDFNVTTWRAPCKCNHTHEDHSPNPPYKCTLCTKCFCFQSYFACISCDQSWENHQTLFETELERKQQNKPIGQAYLPLAQNPDIQQMVFDQNNKVITNNNLNLMRPRPPQQKAIKK